MLRRTPTILRKPSAGIALSYLIPLGLLPFRNLYVILLDRGRCGNPTGVLPLLWCNCLAKIRYLQAVSK
ncbi:MAG TPA: hypothetical protein GX521_08280 [Firmicutes bacterium]|nr:hypothetical protein [Bacillota bacterium]